MKRNVYILGFIIFFLPIFAVPVGFVLCMIAPGNYCLAAPFVWMLLWPAYLIGIAVMALAAFLPAPESKSTSPNWQSKIGAIIALAVVSAIFGVNKWGNHQSKNDESAAIEFAKGSSTVHQASGLVSDLSLSEYSQPKFGLPTRYVIWIDAPEPFHAVVDANRSWAWGAPNFSLACLAPASLGEMDASKDECGKSRH